MNNAQPPVMSLLFSNFAKRALFNAAKRSSKNPIEMIVAVLILASFCYFYLFNLAKDSELFVDSSQPRLAPAVVFAPHDTNQFVPYDSTKLKPVPNAVRLKLKQLVISDPTDAGSHHGHQGVLTRPVLASVLHFQEQIEKELFVADGSNRYVFNDDLCYRLPASSHPAFADDDRCFTQSPLRFWDNDPAKLAADKDIFATIARNVDSSSFLFKDLRINATEDKEGNVNVNSASSLILSYAFDANGPYRSQLANLWEDKVASISSGDFVSQSSSKYHQKGTIAWLAMFASNVVFKIKELIDVRIPSSPSPLAYLFPPNPLPAC